MTGRSAISGVERRWASPAALGVCPRCGARGESHDRERCQWSGADRPQANGSPPTPAAALDDLRGAVLAALRAYGPLSGNATVRTVGRRRGAVLAVLRALEADGQVRRNGAGWASR